MDGTVDVEVGCPMDGKPELDPSELDRHYVFLPEDSTMDVDLHSATSSVNLEQESDPFSALPSVDTERTEGTVQNQLWDSGAITVKTEPEDYENTNEAISEGDLEHQNPPSTEAGFLHIEIKSEDHFEFASEDVGPKPEPSQVVDSTDHQLVPPIVLRFSCNDCSFKTDSKRSLDKHKLSHSLRVTHSDEVSLNTETSEDQKPSVSEISFLHVDVKSEGHFEFVDENNDLKTEPVPIVPSRDLSFTCNVCSFKTESKRSLAKHKSNHSSRVQCNVTSNESTHLHVNSGERSYVCGDCNYISPTSEGLDIHECGQSDQRFQCGHCDFKSHAQSVLDEHLRTHTGERPYISEITYKITSRSRATSSYSAVKIFRCTQCVYRCDRKDSIVTHMRTHTGEKPYACGTCSYTCVSNSGIAKHRKIHTNVQSFPCDMCDSVFSVKRILVNHLLSRHSKKILFKCDECSYQCVREKTFTQHKLVHVTAKLYNCSQCQYETNRKYYIILHLRKHSGERPFACSLRGYKSVSDSGLSIHKRRNHGLNKCVETKVTVRKPHSGTLTDMYNCSHCSYETNRKDSIIHHLRVHSGERSFACSLCSHKSVYKSNIVTHMKSHTRSFMCDICTSSFTVKSRLVQHIKLHTATKSGLVQDLTSQSTAKLSAQLYNCSHCLYGTNRKATLISHLRSHSGDRPYACLICSYTSASRNGLVTHNRRHKSVQYYNCNECNFRTNRRDTLISHFRQHTGERPFACALCSFTSATSSGVNNHKKNKHTSSVEAESSPAQQYYNCSHCDYVTVLKRSIVTHLRRHTGERPFACDVCSFAYATSSGLKYHKKKHAEVK